MVIEVAREERKDSKYQQIIGHLTEAWDTHEMQPKHLENGITKDVLLQKTADVLLFHDMDEEFYNDPENGFLALAFTHERMAAGEDKTKAWRADTAFDLLTGTNSESYFSYSAQVRNTYNPDFTPVVPMMQTSRRTTTNDATTTTSYGFDHLHKIAGYTPISKEMTINGMNVWDIGITVADRLGLPRTLLEDIHVGSVDAKTLVNTYGVDALTTGKYIVARSDCPRNMLMHEFVHALSGMGFLRGHKYFFLRGILEALTEIMTEKPSMYPRQREVLTAIFHHIPDHRLFHRYLGQAYRGNESGRKEMWKLLMETYGLRGVIYFGLLDQETPIFMRRLLGAENAKVYIPTEEVLAFFSQPKTN